MSDATNPADVTKPSDPRDETMRIADSEALERAAQKVERLHRLYLRTPKALQDQRRNRRPAIGSRGRIFLSAVCSVKLT